jgi:hypothetical protein
VARKCGPSISSSIFSFLLAGYEWRRSTGTCQQWVAHYEFVTSAVVPMSIFKNKLFHRHIITSILLISESLKKFCLRLLSSLLLLTLALTHLHSISLTELQSICIQYVVSNTCKILFLMACRSTWFANLHELPCFAAMSRCIVAVPYFFVGFFHAFPFAVALLPRDSEAGFAHCCSNTLPNLNVPKKMLIKLALRHATMTCPH